MADILRTDDIRQMLKDEFVWGDRQKDGTVELRGVSFIADESTIFGLVNNEYVERELQWYESQSLDVNDIPGGPPPIWKRVADKDGYILSNYGYLFKSMGNGDQFGHVVDALVADPDTRQAVAVYTSPTVHGDSKANGRSDFICTNAVQYLIRDGELEIVVQMRSNDAVFGYRNDLAWQRHAMYQVIEAYLERTGDHLMIGDIHWQVGSLHVYPRHHHLLQHYADTGKFLVPVTKEA